ncbi:DoxX family protein [Deinococcus pimensis]|uniref:DoxX family protein n=1 Tax=Deinococcus pimensis TaxID=309888 RepID=UPI0004BA313D|nr:DoxX family protein [Deinococcus pimensis]
MLKTLLLTTPSLTPLLLRLVLGLVILPHGLQKAFGLFGGFGFTATMQYFGSLHIPPVFGLLAILAESVGALMLIFGAATRLAALGVGVTMTVAALTVHLPNGFFMNWFGQQKGEGLEFFLLAVTMSLALVARGAGALSIDRSLTGTRSADELPAYQRA